MATNRVSQVNQGTWCQETYETSSRDARRRARQLRQAGYQVSVSPIGVQVTDVGLIRLTMVDIRPGTNANTSNLPEVECCVSLHRFVMKPIKTIRSYVGFSQFLSECQETGREVPRKVQEPYSFSLTQVVWNWKGMDIIVVEAAHRLFRVFKL